MAGKVTTYGSEAFAYLSIQRDAILDTAQRLGLSAAAIAGAMAEERDAYARHPDRNLWLDQRAQGELASHQIIVNQLGIVQTLGIADSSNPGLKIIFPVLLDVGFANFKFTTAIRLLERYSNEWYPEPASDPLNLKQYNGNYRQLLLDMLIEGNSVTPDPAPTW